MTLKKVNRKKNKKLQSRLELESVNLSAIRMTHQKYKTLNKKINNKKQMMMIEKHYEQELMRW